MESSYKGKILEVDLDKNSLALVDLEKALEFSLAELEQVGREDNDIRLDFAPNEDVGDSFCSITFKLRNQSSRVEELYNKLSRVMVKGTTPLATIEGVKAFIPRHVETQK